MTDLTIPQIDALCAAFPQGLRRFRRGWATTKAGPFHPAATVAVVLRAGFMREAEGRGRHVAALTAAGYLAFADFRQLSEGSVA